MISHFALRRIEGGFALLDMLVSLAVAGLFMSVLLSSVSFVTHEQGVLRAREETRESALTTKRLLTALIESAPVLPGPMWRPDLSGSEMAFSIRSVGPAVLALPEPVVFQVAAVSHNGGVDLIVSWNDPQVNDERRRTIARGLRQASFNYFIRDTKQTAMHWRPTASTETAQIEAIRLTLRSADAGSAIEIISPVRGEVPALCANPTINQACRARRP